MGTDYLKNKNLYKKGSKEHENFSKNFALSFEEILDIQENLQSHLDTRPACKIYANLKKLGKNKNFSVYLNKKEPKFNFKDCYNPTEEEESAVQKERIRSYGQLIKLMKTHFGLNCSIYEIEELMKVNRGIKVVKRMIQFENNRIKLFIEDLRKEKIEHSTTIKLKLPGNPASKN